MTPKDEDLGALRELESTIVDVWSHHSEMNDYTAGRAYTAAFQHYRDRLRNHETKPPSLSGLDLETFNAVQAKCQQLLASGAPPLEGKSKGEAVPVSLEKLVDYLRELSRSVERHTKHGGRRGYLEFVRTFIDN